MANGNDLFMGFDLSGDDELSGDDLMGSDSLFMGEDILGAAVRRAVKRGQPLNARTLARAVQQTQQGAQQAAMAQARGRIPAGIKANAEQILPIDSGTTVAAGATSVITASPQRPFRPERFVVQSAITGSFLINDITVGADSQFVSKSGAIPADVFANNAVGTRLKGTSAVPGVQIQISVTNTTGGALRFLAALIGEALD
jgi:hypothetical protein